MPKNPRDDKPMTPMFQCLDCETIFSRPDTMVIFGKRTEACPLCLGPDDEFDPLPNAVVRGLFWHLVSHCFTEERRINLRMIAEGQMAPLDSYDI